MSLSDPALLALLSVGLLFTGCIAGVLAGLLGVGGGIVVVPVLYLLFDALNFPETTAMHLAVGTSLATIIPVSISSARSHHAKGAIDLEVLKAWALFMFIGAAFGGFVARYLSSSALTLVFGLVALMVAINMMLPKKIVLSDALPSSTVLRSTIATGIGVFSAWMGIGGGTLTVPILTMFSFPVHRAVGTAAAFGFFIAVPAVVGFIAAGWGEADRPPYSLGYVSLPAALCLFVTSVFAAPVGSRLAHSLNPEKLRMVFAVFLLLSSLRMLYKVSFT